jgi:hypothetical protein
VGNKCDVGEDSKTSHKVQVTYQNGLEFMQKYNLNYFTEISAKTGKGINEVVEYMAKVVFHHNKNTILGLGDDLKSSKKDKSETNSST